MADSFSCDLKSLAILGVAWLWREGGAGHGFCHLPPTLAAFAVGFPFDWLAMGEKGLQVMFGHGHVFIRHWRWWLIFVN
jgi:hypothetical protein